MGFVKVSSDCGIIKIVINKKGKYMPAKKKTNKGLLGAIGAATLGLAAGAAAVFLSRKENRDSVQRTVSGAVKKGKAEVAKVKKSVIATKKKLLKK